jgi:hypothetical protein
MTQYSSYGIKLGMDIGAARAILEKNGFFTRSLKNNFFSNCIESVKGELSILIMGGMLNKVAALTTIISHQTEFTDHDKTFLENACHLEEIRGMIGIDGLYSAAEKSLVDISNLYKYEVKDAIINTDNELMLFLSDRVTPKAYRWIKVIMSKEPMGFYDFDYEPIQKEIQDEIQKYPDSRIKDLYRIFLISNYFKAGLAEI